MLEIDQLPMVTNDNNTYVNEHTYDRLVAIKKKLVSVASLLEKDFTDTVDHTNHQTLIDAQTTIEKKRKNAITTLNKQRDLIWVTARACINMCVVMDHNLPIVWEDMITTLVMKVEKWAELQDLQAESRFKY